MNENTLEVKGKEWGGVLPGDEDGVLVNVACAQA